MILNSGGGQNLPNLDAMEFGELDNPPSKGKTSKQWYEDIARVIVNAGGGGSDERMNELVTRSVTKAIDTAGVIDTIRNYVFASCTALTSVSFPSCTSIGYSAFFNCTALTSVSFPVCTTIGSGAFYFCSSLTTANFPVCTTIGNSAFYACRSLASVSFPRCTSIGTYAFQYCIALTSASFPDCTSIGGAAFYRCFNLISLYLMGSSVCALSNSAPFGSTPIGGYSASAGQYGSIYVPASLLTTYQAAANWSRFSSRFVGV